MAYSLGAGGYGLGLVISSVADLPSGPVVVCCLALLALLRALRHDQSAYSGRAEAR